jgi:hypothetical protein
MSESLPIINSMAQQFGIEFYECSIVARQMYYVKFKMSFFYSLNT